MRQLKGSVRDWAGVLELRLNHEEHEGHEGGLELKCVEQIKDIHEEQLLTCMKLAGTGPGLLINFNVRRLRDGIKRFVL